MSADDVTDASGASITEEHPFRQDELPEDRSLIIVDDDRAFAQRLVRAMELREFEVRGGHSVAEGIELIRARAPAFAVVDMRLEDGNGLDVIAELSRAHPNSRAIVLTGYGNIATAVTAVKLGAVDYLAKPAEELILPYVDKLKRSGLSVEQTSIMNTLVSNLMKVTSPAIRKIQTLGLTTREIEVASLLKEGKTTKQIAELLGVSSKQ